MQQLNKHACVFWIKVVGWVQIPEIIFSKKLKLLSFMYNCYAQLIIKA
jgi:hypothetical protein